MIISQVRAGRQRLFGVLVDRHKDRALTLAIRLVGERVEAEDLVQEAFVRAYRHLDTFRGDARFSTWFYRILTNVCLAHRSRAKNRPVLLSDAGPDNTAGVEDLPDAGAGLMETIEEDEMRNVLGEEMEKLPEQYRLALTLFYVQELKYEEIASVLAVPIGTVKTNLFRGRAILRRKVQARIQEAPLQ